MNLILEQENFRLEALKEYEILDTVEEKCYDDITRLAALICQTPFSLLVLIDEKRQWFKSRYGIELKETERMYSFCQHTILRDEILEINETLENELMSNNPFVTGSPFIRFYAGAPLITPKGYKLGSICVFNDRPQALSLDQRESLEILSRQVMLLFENRKTLKKMAISQ